MTVQLPLRRSGNSSLLSPGKTWYHEVKGWSLLRSTESCKRELPKLCLQRSDVWRPGAACLAYPICFMGAESRHVSAPSVVDRMRFSVNRRLFFSVDVWAIARQFCSFCILRWWQAGQNAWCLSFSNLFVAMETGIEETSLLAALVDITEMNGLCLSPWPPCLLFSFLYSWCSYNLQDYGGLCILLEKIKMLIVAITIALYFVLRIFDTCWHRIVVLAEAWEW